MTNKQFLLFPIIGDSSDAVRLHSCVGRRSCIIMGISERVSEINDIVNIFLSSPDDRDMIVTIPPYVNKDEVVSLLRGMLLKFTIC